MMFDDDDDDNNDDDRWILTKRNSRSGGRSDSRYSEANKNILHAVLNTWVRYSWDSPLSPTQLPCGDNILKRGRDEIWVTCLSAQSPWPDWETIAQFADHEKRKKRKRNPRKISHDWPHRQGNPSPPTPQDTNPVWGRQCPTEVRHSESDWACRRAQATFSRHPLAQSNLNDGRPSVVLTPMVLLLGDHPGIGRLWQEWLNNVRKSSNTGSCKDRGYLR